MPFWAICATRWLLRSCLARSRVEASVRCIMALSLRKIPRSLFLDWSQYLVSSCPRCSPPGAFLAVGCLPLSQLLYSWPQLLSFSSVSLTISKRSKWVTLTLTQHAFSSCYICEPLSLGSWLLFYVLGRLGHYWNCVSKVDGQGRYLLRSGDLSGTRGRSLLWRIYLQLPGLRWSLLPLRSRHSSLHGDQGVLPRPSDHRSRPWWIDVLYDDASGQLYWQSEDAGGRYS